MLRSRLVGLCAALVWLPGAAEGQDAVSRLLEAPAARIEPGLPDEPFGDWLRGLLPAGAPPLFRTGPCPEGPGRCVSVELDIVSRARLLRLDFAIEFAIEPPRFLGGSVAAPDAGPQPPIGALAELPGRLVAPIRPQPLECPEGTRPRLREMQAGLHEWCEDLDGLKHGPARSWFATGRYLMTRGRHERGKRVGSWIECDRFERCGSQSYP